MNLNATPQFQETTDNLKNLSPEVKELELNKDTLSAISWTQEKFKDALFQIPENYFSNKQQEEILRIFNKNMPEAANDDNFEEGDNSMVA